jgi:hypothetical protein
VSEDRGWVIPCDVTFWTARWITLDYNLVHLKAGADGREKFLPSRNSLLVVAVLRGGLGCKI